MRKIKFRGKPIEDYRDTKWFYGNAVINYEDKLAYIEASGQGFVPVEWGTVSQYTGLKDSKGNEIYEGDILKYGYIVTYIDGSDTENLGMDIGFYSQRDDFESWALLEVGAEYEVIGNIFESKN